MQAFRKEWHPCNRKDLGIDTLDAIFHTKMTLTRNSVCPEHLVRVRPQEHLRNKWFSKDLRLLRSDNRRLRRRWKKSLNPVDLTSYLKHLKFYKQATKKSKAQYVQTQITEAANKSKALFKISSALLNPNTNSKFSPPNARSYCEEINTYFAQKVKKIRKEVETETQDPELPQALTALHSWSNSCEVPTNNISSPTPDSAEQKSTAPPFNTFRLVETAEVENILRACCPSSSPLDPIPSTIIRDLGQAILPDITNIVNRSLQEGKVPSAWKQGIITPLLKKPGADQNLPQNLRPVTQLRLLPRITEAVVTKQFQDHIEHHGLLHDLQSGFRPGRGTELATAAVREKLLWHGDRSHPAILLLLDLSAAFDTVDHGILLQRLQEIGGVQGAALEWFESFLSGRAQAVKWGSVHSTFQAVPYGVPQGSSLSPLLFNIYMRPLATLLEGTGLQFHMYADDVQILVDLHEEAGEAERLTSCLVLLKDWMRQNKLRLNEAKTELLLLRGKRGAPPPHIPWPASWGVPPLPSDSTRNLGVIFSHRLDGAAHAAATVKTCHWQLNSLTRLFPLLTLAQKKQLYQAAVGSRLSYGLSFMLGATSKTLWSLQRTQNRAIRMICGLTRRDHINLPRWKLGWLSIKDQLRLKIATWIWKAHSRTGPKYTFAWAQLPFISRDRRIPQRNLLALPKFRKSSRGGSTIIRKGTQIWNSLPEEIRGCSSQLQFKLAMKQYLLKEEAVRLDICQSSIHESIEKTLRPRQPTQNFPATGNLLAVATLRPAEQNTGQALPTTRTTTQLPSGLTSPALPTRSNQALITLAARNKAENLRTGIYVPRRLDVVPREG